MRPVQKPRLPLLAAAASLLLGQPAAVRAASSADADLQRHDLVDFMANRETFRVKDFTGDEHQRPEMGCELSDFGSWYDVAYSGGINRFWINSVRHHTYEQVGFNTTQDLGLVALFFETPAGGVIDGSRGSCRVTWHPYGWTTLTREGGLRVESTVVFTAFNTIAVLATVSNAGPVAIRLTPSLLVTDRSDYDGMTGGRIVGEGVGGRLAWCNRRIGKSSDPKDYVDSLRIGSTLGTLRVSFLPRYLRSARGGELTAALRESWSPTLSAGVGAALARTGTLTLAPGEHRAFAFYLGAGADDRAATLAADGARNLLGRLGPAGTLRSVREDWNHTLASLPRLADPSPDDRTLYYASALALRTNRILLERLPVSAFVGKDGSAGQPVAADAGDSRRGEVLYSASCPGRGAFNLFFQSDACWNLLGYLDINPDWAEGHAVPILVPPCIIMDPHFFWSMWELYSRLPGRARERAFAAKVYPLLEDDYRTWITKIDIDHNLLCATPNNWDDGPRADLLFKEATDIPGQWNSWWTDWVNFSRDRFLEDPASSSQLAYGTVVLGRFARILGKERDAEHWRRQFERHVKAIDTLWDEKKGYWIVTYKHSLRDTVLTSSIIYPIFTDVCRDPAKIRRVIEQHILNPKEFNGRFPVPTVAYDDPRYYRQKPPRENEEGGLWRGNIWMPEAWIVVKGLYKYGYGPEAASMARRLLDMMEHQAAFTRGHPQYACVPAEYYDSRTGAAQNNRRFSWSSAVAMDFLLGNYENERVIGANPARDRSVDGHVREIFDFKSGRSLFRVATVARVFPVLHMRSADGRPIESSTDVDFRFEDPAGNFAAESIAFTADVSRWSVLDAATGHRLAVDPQGGYRAALGERLRLVPRS